MVLWKPISAVKLGKPKPLVNLIWLSALAILLSSCVSLYDPESSHDWHTDYIYTLKKNELASQTIVLRQAHLSKIAIWASPTEHPPPDAKVTLSIIDLSKKPKYLLAKTQPLSECQNNQCVFSIPEERSPAPGNYAFLLESTAPLHLWGNRLDSYPQGTFSVNNQSTSSDLGFELEYRYSAHSLLEDTLRLLRDIWLLLPSLAFLIAPGALLLKLIRFPLPFNRSLSFFIVISTSLTIIPVALAWTSTLNLHWNESLVRLIFYLSFLISLYIAIRNSRSWISNLRMDDLLLLLIFIFALFIRLLMSRNLVAPPWVDSVHHALITQLILENGAYPTSFQPYLTTTTTAYHSGFHANLAFFTWLSTLPLPTSMLIFGQILNALAVYSAYTFTLAFYPKRFTGIIAALLVAFFSPMPAYYTSWGRYTQLCGLLILPTPIYLFRRKLTYFTEYQKTVARSTLILIALLFSGLIVIHYRVSYFFTLLLGLSTLERILLPAAHPRIRRAFRLFCYLAIIGILTLIFSATWLPEAWTTLLLPKLTAWNQPPSTPELIPWNLLTAATGKIVLALAGLGLAIEILRRSWRGLTLLIWVFLCFTTIHISSWLSRGVGFINMTSVTISLYLPLSALGAHGTVTLFDILVKLAPRKLSWFLHPLFIGVILIATLLGAKTLVPLLNPITMLVRADDLRAMDFLRNATQPNQKLLIQPFLWGYGLYAGNDGGSWIPALAHRPTIPPPVLFALSDSSEQVRQINQVSQKVLEKPRDASWIAHLMQENGLDYLYLGAKGGAISPYEILQSPYFELIYHQGRVFVFKLHLQQSHP